MLRPIARAARIPLRPALRPSQAAWEASVWRRHPTLASFSSPMAPRPTNQAPILAQTSRLYSTRPTPTASSWLQTLLRAPRRTFRTSGRKGSAESSQGSAKIEGEPQSLGARLRKLSREYGWVAIGVYIALTIADFPICFLIVRMVGTEKIAELEHYAVSKIKLVIPQSVQTFWHEYTEAIKQARKEAQPVAVGGDGEPGAAEMATWGIEKAAEADQAGASLATQLALAYAIHKGVFIFVRVPLAVILTPKAAKLLRSWGWKIGKRQPA